MKMIKHTVWALLALMATSCAQDSFVDVDPLNQINSENFFNTPEDYDMALIGAYDLLQTTHKNVWIAEIASDNTVSGGESANDVVGIQEIDDMVHTPINDQLRNVWEWMYAGVYRTNYIFEFRDKIDFDGKSNVLGQAAFLRAYYYFELVKFFGPIPMPVDERVDFGSEGSYPRVPVDQVYAQIATDLEFAIANLPDVQSEAGRVTKGAAQALLGRALVYSGQYSAALAPLEAVINSGMYDLQADYSTLFLNESENGIENVFSVQYSDQEGAGFGCFQCSEGNIQVGFNGIRGYAGPVYADGFSFNLPTQELVDEFEPGDLRYEPTILDIEAWVGANPGATFIEGYKHTGYYNNKYIPRLGEQFIGDQKLTSNKNYRAIRFSEVLLLAAEAAAETGNDAKAQQYLNRVRARAGLASTTLGGGALVDAIHKERRVELAGEGHRFFDLVRTGEAAGEIDGFVAGKHELFPIPLIEIELAGSVWAQNPGY